MRFKNLFFLKNNAAEHSFHTEDIYYIPSVKKNFPQPNILGKSKSFVASSVNPAAS